MPNGLSNTRRGWRTFFQFVVHAQLCGMLLFNIIIHTTDNLPLVNFHRQMDDQKQAACSEFNLILFKQ